MSLILILWKHHVRNFVVNFFPSHLETAPNLKFEFVRMCSDKLIYDFLHHINLTPSCCGWAGGVRHNHTLAYYTPSRRSPSLHVHWMESGTSVAIIPLNKQTFRQWSSIHPLIPYMCRHSMCLQPRPCYDAGGMFSTELDLLIVLLGYSVYSRYVMSFNWSRQRVI